MGESCSMNERDEKCIQNFEGKRPFGRPRRRMEDNIRMDLREIGWKFADWVHLVQVMD